MPDQQQKADDAFNAILGTPPRLGEGDPLRCALRLAVDVNTISPGTDEATQAATHFARCVGHTGNTGSAKVVFQAFRQRYG